MYILCDFYKIFDIRIEKRSIFDSVYQTLAIKEHSIALNRPHICLLNISETLTYQIDAICKWMYNSVEHICNIHDSA